MRPVVSDRNRKVLFQSLSPVRANKSELIKRMQTNLELANAGQIPGRSENVASELTEMLISQVAQLLDRGEFGNLDEIRNEHDRLQLTGQIYSRFGDALIPILKDLVGPDVPVSAPGAWCQTFWSIIGKVNSDQKLETV